MNDFSECPKHLYVNKPGSTENGVYEIATYKLNGKNYWTKLDGTRFIYYNKYFKDFKVVEQKYFGIGESAISYIRSDTEVSAAANCPNEIPQSSWKYRNKLTTQQWMEWKEPYPLISIWNGEFRSNGKYGIREGGSQAYLAYDALAPG